MTHPPLLRLVPALAAAGLLSWAGPAAGQDTSCRGWTASCAAVEVRAEGDRLILFSPNAAPHDAGSSTGEDTGAPSDRVRVLADRPGATCDAATGSGCEDYTAVWTATPAGDAAASSDPGNLSCRRDEVWMARARGIERSQNRCRRAPVAAFFLVALPVGLYVFGPDGQTPLIESPLPGDPGAGLPDPGEGSTGGANGGDGTGGDSAGGTGGDSAGGSGGDSTGGSGGDSTGGSGGDSTGGTGGDSGGGTPGGDSTGGNPGDPPGGSDPWDGELGLPPEDPRPPMSEVPEPISTTLFGLGLAGYAGARLKKRRAERLEGGEDLA